MRGHVVYLMGISVSHRICKYIFVDGNSIQTRKYIRFNRKFNSPYLIAPHQKLYFIVPEPYTCSSTIKWEIVKHLTGFCASRGLKTGCTAHTACIPEPTNELSQMHFVLFISWWSPAIAVLFCSLPSLVPVHREVVWTAVDCSRHPCIPSLGTLGAVEYAEVGYLWVLPKFHWGTWWTRFKADMPYSESIRALLHVCRDLRFGS